MSKLTTAILDVLSDGEWHTSKEITDRACVMASAKRKNVAAALHDMTDSNKIKRQRFGNTDHDYQYRMGCWTACYQPSEVPMRMTWFVHDPVDTDTAAELLSRYASRSIKTQKTLSADPRLWLVSALLPEFREEPKPSRQYKNPMWS